MFVVAIDSPDRPSTELAPTVAALDPFGNADRLEKWSDGRCHVVRAITYNTAESKRLEAVATDPVTGNVAIVWARLDDRANLQRALGDALSSWPSPTDADLVLAAHRKWGDRAPEKLTGAFAYVIWNPESQQVFAARDQLGFKPLFYYHDNERLIISTTGAAFPALSDLRLDIDDEWMSWFIVRASMTVDRTAWSNVRKLPRGHLLRSNGDAAPRIEQYHDFVDDSPPAKERSNEWVDAYRSILDEAVRDRIRTDYPLGCETSGGIDSSTCLAFAARDWDGPIEDIHTFGNIGCEHEPDFIYETSRAFGIVNDHIGTRGDFGCWETDASLDILGYPEEHGMGTSHVHFYLRAQENNVRTLLSGFGGDEVVTNPGRLAFREWVAERQWGQIYKSIHGRRAVKPLRFARTLQRELPRFQANNHLSTVSTERWQGHILRPEADAQYGVGKRHAHKSRYTADYPSINAWVLDERLGNPFVPSRLESCTIVANAFGIEYRWPLLDHRLVQQWLSTPTVHKYGPGLGRYLHRQAIEGVVPHKVAFKPGKDMGDSIQQTLRPSADGSNPAPVPRVRLGAGDLHPRLLDIVDPAKFDNAQSIVGTVKSLPAADFFSRGQVRAVVKLNEWLSRNSA